jgi:predicted amidophosphoribosyltransferase
LYYSDFYAIERIGKTKLGVLLHIAKQTQNINLMREIVIHVKSSIEKLIQADGITAVGFIPPSIKREIQFMQVFKDSLNLPLPHIDLVKAKGEIIIPQKSISKLEERIENARTTIMINDKRHFQHVLLIDDAVGSGASINETALKLKSRKLAKKVTGYAITGSFKGFDVLQEV